jgi:tetratricopeptide (TPR) repeat protein
LMAEKDYDQAASRANSTIDEFKRTGSQDLYGMLPGAYLVKGQADFMAAVEQERDGRVTEAKERYAEARWSFLHVIVQFFENDDYVSKAHFLAGQCSESLKKLGGADANLEKALFHYQEILRSHPNSVFKKLAEERLTALQPAATPPAGAVPEKGEEGAAPAPAPTPTPAPEAGAGGGEAKKG